MKKSFAIAIASVALVLSLGTMAGCSGNASSPTNAGTNSSASNSAAVVNPVTECDSLDALAKETGITIVTPDSWGDQYYSVCNTDQGKIAEIQFVYGGYYNTPCIVRAMKTDDANADISGVYGTAKESTEYKVDTTTTATIRLMDDDIAAVMTWYNSKNKTAYSIFTTKHEGDSFNSLKTSLGLLATNFNMKQK